MGNNGANRKNGKLIIIIIIMIMTKIVATYIVAVDWLNALWSDHLTQYWDRYFR